MEEFKKEVLFKSWQSTSYQQAIWKARRRLAGKQEGYIDNQEAKILIQNLLWDSKPDYSRWSSSDVGLKRNVIPSPRRNLTNEDNPETAPLSEMEAPNLEYLSVVDQAPLHKPSAIPPKLSGTLPTSFRDFGLCIGCFHKKGPHYHYHAPVRIGGGYSIYQRTKTTPSPIDGSDIEWNTTKWLADLGKATDDLTSGYSSLGFGDSYSVQLFNQYLGNGGDAAALKEYLESNFNPEVLEEIRKSGVDVELLQEYTDLYRKHIRTLMEENIQKQSKVMEKQGKTLDFAVMYSSLESDGVDMKVLLALLRKGRMHKSVLKFEREGGNTEILEHFAQQIDNDPSRDIIVFEFEKILEKSEQHQKAQIFMDYLKSGGSLKILKTYLSGDLRHLQNDTLIDQNEIAKLQACIDQFPSETDCLKELKVFLQQHITLYRGAELLQEFIESGGNMKTLKHFVASDCDISAIDTNETKDDTQLLERVGRRFQNSPSLKKALEEFPDEPELIEAYIQSGGSFPFLVKAVSHVTESSKLEDYVFQEAHETMKKLNRNNQGAHGNGTTIHVEHRRTNEPSPTDSLPTLLLPRILEKAKADLMYNDLIDAETNLKTNEGVYLSRSVDLQVVPETPSPPVDASERREVIRVYKTLTTSHSPSFSSSSAKGKTKLWQPPKPFEIRESHRSPTNPQSPFSHHRVFDISSLSENQITQAAKQQRSHLNALRRDIKIEEFQNNWKLSITSPRGSVISLVDSKNDTKENSLIDEVIAKVTPPRPPPAAPVDKKKSRRQKQRDKLRAAKNDSNDRRTPIRRAPIPSTPSLLQPPQDQTATLRDFPDALLKMRENKERKTEKREKHRNNRETDALPAMDKNKDEMSHKEQTLAPVVEPPAQSEKQQVTLPTPKASEAVTAKPLKRTIKHQHIQQPRYATAFGPKSLTSSYSSFLSANSMKKLRDNPDTMMSSLDSEDTITLMSKSESNLDEFDHMHQAVERLSKKILERRRKSFHRPERKSNKFDDITDDVDDYAQAGLIDLLKQYCIIREDRLHIYKRIFEKYVLMKRVREQERALERRRTQKSSFTVNDDEPDSHSLEGELKKNQVMMKNIKENIVHLQEQIAATKGSINAATSYSDRNVKTMVGFMTAEENMDFSEPTSDELPLNKKTDIFNGQNSEHLRKFESEAEIRDRKVALAHLRSKVKSMKQRQKSLEDSSKRLRKSIQQELVAKRFHSREKYEFTKQQSRIYRELHPLNEDVMDPSDLKNALNDLDKGLTFFDPSQFTEEITQSKGVRFQVFCVLAALLETKNFLPREPCPLSSKINFCKEYYGSLLGPGLERLQIELEAAGITRPQRDEVMRKLSRGNQLGKFEFLDFVTYSPLFLAAHAKIIENPLA